VVASERTIRLSGHAPLLTGAVPLRVARTGTTIDLSDLTFATPFDLVGLAAWVWAIPPGRPILLRRPTLKGVWSLVNRDIPWLFGQYLTEKIGRRNSNVAVADVCRQDDPARSLS
jgi:hypothetical protein